MNIDDMSLDEVLYELSDHDCDSEFKVWHSCAGWMCVLDVPGYMYCSDRNHETFIEAARECLKRVREANIGE